MNRRRGTKVASGIPAYSRTSISNEIRIIPIGGVGEIGKNMMLIEYAEGMLIVDAGMMFPEDDMPGVDFVIPDFIILIPRPLR